METDHLRVANGRQNDSGDSARERQTLDEDIISRLEHPGRWLGPLTAPRVEPAHATRAVLLWPSAPETINVPTAVEPLWVNLHRAGPAVELAYAPPADLAQALAAAGRGAITVGSWSPLLDFPLWLVWCHDPTQVFGLLSVLESCGLAPWAEQRAASSPVVVVAGPGARAAAPLFQPFADAVLLDDGLDAIQARAEALSVEDPRQVVDRWVADDARVLGARPADPVLDLEETGGPAARREEPTLWPVQRDDLTAPPHLSHRGLNGARVATISPWAADEGLRRRWGLAPGADLAGWVVDVLSEPAGQIVLRLAVGLPGETDQHRAALPRLVRDIVERAPRKAKQLRVELGVYARSAEEAATWGRPTLPQLTGWLKDVVDGVGVPKLRVSTGDPTWAWTSSILRSEASGLAGAVVALHRQGLRRGESRLAHDAVLWHKALEVGKIFPQLSSGPATEAAPNDGGTGVTLGSTQDGTDPSDSSRASTLPAPAETRPGGAARVDKWSRWRDLARRQFEYRLEYSKRGRLRLLGHRELVEIFMKAFHDARLPVATSGVVQPRPRVSFGPPLPVGVEGLREYVDVGLTRKIDDLKARLVPRLPVELRIRRTRFVPLPPGRTSLGLVALADYEALIATRHWRAQPLLSADLEARFAALEALEKPGNGPSLNIDQVVSFAALDAADGLRLSFRLDLSSSGPKCKPQEFLDALFEGTVEDVRSIPMRRTHLLTRNPHPHRPLLSPMEQLAAAERQMRARARWCA